MRRSPSVRQRGATSELGPLAAFFHDIVARIAPLAHTASRRARVAFFRLVGRHEAATARTSSRSSGSWRRAVAGEDRVIEGECRYAKGCRAAYDGRLYEAAQHCRRGGAASRRRPRRRALGIELAAPDPAADRPGSLALARRRLARVPRLGPSAMQALICSRQAGPGTSASSTPPP
jgi:hypothetical protein